jgi:hypothetical protein
MMMNGYGWCLLRATRPGGAGHLEPDPDARDEQSDHADSLLWASFRAWMGANGDPFMVWQFSERSNNDSGVLTFSVSRNHRLSGVWEMLDWIAVHGPGSYGLFFVHDDEDNAVNDGYGRAGVDYSNTYRVHRLLHGTLTEMEDPFFGAIWPGLED